MKKCVIIGSGLGGLVCGYILGKNGYDVTILEKEAQFGGCLQCFHREGVIFDTGVHYIGSADKGQTLDTLLHYLGIDKDIELHKLDADGYDIVSINGKHYAFGNGKEGFINGLAKHFPNSRGELTAYYDLVKKVAAASPIHSLHLIGTDPDTFAEYQMRSVNEVIEETVSDPELRNVLAGRHLLYAGVKDHTPFSTHSFVCDSYDASAYRIIGGSERVTLSLVKSIEAFGGRIFNHSEVAEIICEDREAKEVVTTDGRHFKADYVISDIHPAAIIDMIKGKALRPMYRKRIKGLRNTTSAFSLYLKFRKDCVPYMNHNLFCFYGNDTWGCNEHKEQLWPRHLIYTHTCQEKNPKYAVGGEAIAFMDYDEIKQWEGTTRGQRGADYEQFKKEKAEKIIDMLEREFPDVRSYIETYYTSSPLTMHDYTGVSKGAMYGIAKDIFSDYGGKVSHKTRVNNLFLAGQNTLAHGMLGVMVGSIIVCSELLTPELLLNQINESL
ncbi:MAG: NAD(P)/FAD-dependent oxidoreductase [Bacteroidaceae bacterium]|nr:NAD(P)/FAD-dependent oxidoreductase [Bacteroidaceae bacterium]